MSESQTPLPRAAPDLLGHAPAEAALLDAWRSGRMPHAWLIAGPRGIGKATLAYRVARFVLAQGGAAGGLFAAGAPPDSLTLGAADPTFKLVASGGHPDLYVLQQGMPKEKDKDKADYEPSAEIIVHWVREAIATLHLTPSTDGGWRVLVVDEAERMNRNAENALLKILEEPLPRTLILLVSHAAGRLLPTTRSRCRLLPMTALAPEIVATLLHRHAPDLASAEREAIAALAEGSIGRALELARSDGLGLHGELIAFSAELPRLDAVRLHALADRVGGPGAAAKDEFRTFLELLAAWTARLAKAAAGAAAPELAPGEAPVLRRLAALGPLHWLDAWDRTRRLAAAADGLNLDRRQTAIGALRALAEGRVG